MKRSPRICVFEATHQGKVEIYSKKSGWEMVSGWKINKRKRQPLLLARREIFGQVDSVTVKLAILFLIGNE